jgi:hypothetical protein
MKWLTKSDIEASLPRLSHAPHADFGTRGLRIDKVVPNISPYYGKYARCLTVSMAKKIPIDQTFYVLAGQGFYQFTQTKSSRMRRVESWRVIGRTKDDELVVKCKTFEFVCYPYKGMYVTGSLADPVYVFCATP